MAQRTLYDEIYNEYTTYIREEYDDCKTRLNTAKLICRIIENRGYYLYKDCENYFKDCDDHNVQTLKQLGIMVGDGNKNFFPDNQISEYELGITLRRTVDYLNNEKKLLSSDNNANQGFVYENDDYYYYTAPVSGYPQFQYGFYSYNRETQEIMKIDNCSVHNIQEYDGKIYYTDSHYEVKCLNENIVTDVGIQCWSDMCIYDGYIYGCFNPKEYKLYRYNLLTGDNEVLSETICKKISMDENCLYFMDKNNLLKMIVGEWKPKLIIKDVTCFSISKDYIYYSTIDSLYKLNKSTGETEMLMTGYGIEKITVYNNNIYCIVNDIVSEDDRNVVRPFLAVVKNGDLKKILDEPIKYFVVGNGYIYYTYNNDLNCLSIRQDDDSE